MKNLPSLSRKVSCVFPDIRRKAECQNSTESVLDRWSVTFLFIELLPLPYVFILGELSDHLFESLNGFRQFIVDLPNVNLKHYQYKFTVLIGNVLNIKFYNCKS